MSENDSALRDFVNRVGDKRERENVYINWHMDAFVEGGIPLPYSVDASYHNVSVHGEYNRETGESPLDVEATLDVLAKCVKFARERDMKVEKNYDSSDFEVCVTLDQEKWIKVRYHAPRDAVCTKRIVGTKVIPAKMIPESIEEVYEWDCEPVSLLARDTADSE